MTVSEGAAEKVGRGVCFVDVAGEPHATDAKRPLIGIPAAIAEPTSTGYVNQKVGDPYVRALVRAGAVPALLPVIHDTDQLSEMVSAMLDRVDGVLFQGGGDIRPDLYDQAPHPSVGGVNYETDIFELELCRQAVNRGKPVLAVCRGIQILNVALGGTLIQDIPSVLTGDLVHRQKTPRNEAWHPIQITPGSRLADILGCSQVAVNSLHHQAIDHLAPGLVVSARAEDGVVEAVEKAEGPMVVGVQFHPEETTETVPATARLFGALVRASRQPGTARTAE